MVLLLMSVILIFIFVGFKLYLSPPTKWCKSQRCLVGTTVVITGANTGIGYEAALDFAKRGAKVILACRDPKKATEAQQKIIQETDNPNIFTKTIDMASLASVRNFAKELSETEDRLDILVNNAGMTFAYDEKSEDGNRLLMQVNHYSHFLLTLLLLGLMKKSGKPSRIVNVSSLAAAFVRNFDVSSLREPAGNLNEYGYSKLCNLLFTKELAKKLENTNITTYSVHPGCIKTGIFRNAKSFAKISIGLVEFLFYKSVQDGAQTIVYCSVTKNIEKFSGHHFDNCKRVDDYRTARSREDAENLWKLTEDIVNLNTEKWFQHLMH